MSVLANQSPSRERVGALGAGMVYLTANVLAAGAQFLMLPLLTHVLTPAQFGRVTMFLIFVQLGNAFAGLGQHGAVGVAWFNREGDDLRRFVSACVIVAAASTVIAAVVAWTLFATIGEGVGLESAWIAGAFATAGATTLVQMRIALWQSQRRPFAAATTQIVNVTANIGLSLVGVLVLGLGAEGRMGGMLFGAALVAAVAMLLLSRDGILKLLPTAAQILDALRFGVLLIPHTLAGAFLFTADRFAVADSLDLAAVGVYGAAAQLGAVMTLLADAFGKTYAPWLFERLARGAHEDLLRVVGVTYLAIPVFLALAGAVGVALTYLGPFLVGPAFQDALPLVPLFLVGGAFTGMYYTVSNLYFFANRTGRLSVVTVSAGASAFVLASLLVGTWGLRGGAIAFAVSQAVMFGLSLAVAIRLRPLPWAECRAAVRAALQVR